MAVVLQGGVMLPMHSQVSLTQVLAANKLTQKKETSSNYASASTPSSAAQEGLSMDPPPLCLLAGTAACIRTRQPQSALSFTGRSTQGIPTAC